MKPSTKRYIPPLVALLLTLSLCACTNANVADAVTTDTSSNVASSDVATVTPTAPISFPLSLEGGAIEVDNVLRYSGTNPDAGWADATDAVALTVRNNSASQLTSASFSMTLTDVDTGERAEQSFTLSELPAGGVAMLIAKENETVSNALVCTDLRLTGAVFDTPMLPEGILVSTDGITVTLTNTSENELSNIDVYCRNVFDGTYFGGAAYKYSVEKLSSGGSAVVTADECFLGEVAVVRVSTN